MFKNKKTTKTNKKTQPIISIILDKPSCCYTKNEMVKGSVKISNIKRKVNHQSIFIKGYYQPSTDLNIHKLYPDVSKLGESVIYEQENQLGSNIEIKGVLKKKFEFLLMRHSNKDFPENYNGELYKMKYEVFAKGTIDDSSEGVAQIEFLIRNYTLDVPTIEKPFDKTVEIGKASGNQFSMNYQFGLRSSQVDITDGLDGQLTVLNCSCQIKQIYACLIRTEWIRTDSKKIERTNAWQNLEIVRGNAGNDPIEFYYPFPKNSVTMPHKKHSHFGVDFYLGVKVLTENGDLSTNCFPISFWRQYKVDGVSAPLPYIDDKKVRGKSAATKKVKPAIAMV